MESFQATLNKSVRPELVEGRTAFDKGFDKFRLNGFKTCSVLP
jgi:hypothetical protein